MLSILLALLWALAVNLAALAGGAEVPGRRIFVLIAVGIPVLGLGTWQHGPWVGFLFFAVGLTMLRWPLAGFGDRLGRAKRRDIR